MNQRNAKINTKLQKLGQMLGLENSDIIRARNTVKNMLSVAIVAGILILISRFIVTQLDAVGLYYIGVSIKDFGFFSRFF
ncbi:MAG: hypothetical protein JSW62_03470 [Thermoplasmatales archaeon]|nr:MAG: hypothetical protein JSW62_03470 [Thermoplasmatales archaeon]